MTYGDDTISINPVARFGSIALGAGAYWLGGLVPLLLIGVAVFAVKKLMPRLSDSASLFAGLTLGQLCWFLIGVIFVAGSWLTAAPDILIGAGLLALFLYRPTLVPATLIILFQVVGLGINIWVLANVDFPSLAGNALVLHMALRLAIIGLGGLFIAKRNDVPADVEAFE